MSLNSVSVLTAEDEDYVFGNDIQLKIIDGKIDLDVDDRGDLKVTEGLSELVVNLVSFILNIDYDVFTGQGELPFHPTFGSSFRKLIFNPLPSDEYLRILQSEIIMVIVTNFEDLIKSVQFTNSYKDVTDNSLHFDILITTVTGGTVTLTMGV